MRESDNTATGTQPPCSTGLSCGVSCSTAASGRSFGRERRRAIGQMILKAEQKAARDERYAA
ncbi:MAG: hypothetical protein ACTSYE_04985, partial [Alphaproteobacteria bacterium]